ncbi:hypothetical protein STEG23_021954 [Scotinomys teguina]
MHLLEKSPWFLRHSLSILTAASTGSISPEEPRGPYPSNSPKVISPHPSQHSLFLREHGTTYSPLELLRAGIGAALSGPPKMAETLVEG